jgi:hypothetical protein
MLWSVKAAGPNDGVEIRFGHFGILQSKVGAEDGALLPRARLLREHQQVEGMQTSAAE